MQDAALLNYVIDVGDMDFDVEVADRSKTVPVVVDFWAPWCGPCRTLGPALEALAAEKAGAFVLAKVNIDEAQELANAFRVESIPMVVAFRDGQPVLKFVGLLPDAELRQFINQLLPSEADKQLTEALTNEATDPTTAERVYRTILTTDTNNEVARVSLARLMVQAGKDAEATELLAPLGVSDEVGAEAERLRRILETRIKAGTGNEADLRAQMQERPDAAEPRLELGKLLAGAGKYEEALTMLLAAAERDKQIAKTDAREWMVKVFQIIGVRSPMAEEYRDKLRGLLY